MSDKRPIFCIPSANPAQASATFAMWRAFGYRTAAVTDGIRMVSPPPANCDYHLHLHVYRGWPYATNAILRYAKLHTDADFFVAGGDDMEPDPSMDPMTIARQCAEHFGGTYGVMQPIGDDFGNTKNICGSPWIGRKFLERFDGGQGVGGGVFCEKFHHYFADEHLFRQARAAGRLWLRADLTQYHRHYSRTGGAAPAYTLENQKFWAHDKAVFEQLVAA